MNSVNFYHLKNSNTYSVLSKLIEKALEQEEQILIRTGSSTATNEIDEFLWSYDLSSFLPHSILGDQESTFNSIHISNEFDNPNNAQFFFVINTGNVNSGEILRFKRSFILFNDDDLDILEFSQKLWMELKNKSVERKYWTQEDKRWVLKES